MMSAKDQKKGALVPRLRFPEFRDAGEWVRKKVHQIAKIYKGKGISKADISSDGKQLCIRYGELYTLYSEVILEVISKTSLPADSLFLSKVNDVIIPSSGETKIDIATSSCVMKDDIALGGDLNIIRACQNGIFISYYFNGNLKEEIAKKAQGDTVVHLYPSQLDQLDIAIPSKKEQQRIADCLSSLDERIAAETNKLDALKDHKKGLLKQLFPAEGETLPQLRFPEFRDAGEWGQAPLGELLLSQPDYGLNAPAVPYTSSLPTYIRITDISEEGQFIVEKKVSVDVVAVPENCLHPGDIVLARTGASVGKAYKYNENDGILVFAGFLIRVKPNWKKINSNFLFNFLFTKRYWDWVVLTSPRSGQPGINSSEYATLPVPTPPSDGDMQCEQQRIADCLSSLDELIAAQTQKINLLKDHKKGLMQQLFPALDEVRA